MKNIKNINVCKKCDKVNPETILLNENANNTHFEKPAEMVLSSYWDKNNNDKFILKYISQLYNNNTIPRSAIKNIIENTSELLTNLIQNMKSQLQSENVDVSLSTSNSNYTEPFKNFNTEFKRFSYLEKLEFLIKPKSFFIGQILDNVNTTSGVKIKMKNCEGQIIPIETVLKKFLELPNVLHSILSYIAKENSCNNISSIFNTSLWKFLTSKYDKNRIILPLYIFFDDFETGNPLGTHAGVHKLGAMYFTLGGIPPKYSSQF